MQPLYTALKVNNEIELCEVNDVNCKQLIERELLKSRISYYIRWTKGSFLHRHKSNCVICINENAQDEAEELVRSICDESGYQVKFLLRKSTNHYL